MSREMRYILGRVIAGLLIGIGMFYFGSAHAVGEPSFVQSSAGLFIREALAPSPNIPTFRQQLGTIINVTASPQGPKVAATRTVPFLAGRLPVVAVETLTVGASVARVVVRAYPAILIASTLYDAYKQQGISVNPTTGEITKTGPARATWYIHAIGSYANRCPTTCTVNQTFTSNQDIFGACFSTCAAGSELRNKPAPFTGTDASITTLYPKADLCTVGGGCYGEAGIILYKTGQTVPGTIAPATDTELDEAWRAGNGDLQKDLVQRAVNADVGVALTEEEIQLDLAHEIRTNPAVKTSYELQPDGTTKIRRAETTTVVRPTVSGTKLATQTITPNATEETVTKDENGNVISRTTSTKPQGEAEVETKTEPPPTFNDSAFPGVPVLYVQKYQTGLVGVWNDKKPQLMNSAFMQSVSASFPTFSSGGECPVWSINLNFGQYANFGTQALKVPCFVWNAIALIFLITASFSARRIIFGG